MFKSQINLNIDYVTLTIVVLIKLLSTSLEINYIKCRISFIKNNNKKIKIYFGWSPFTDKWNVIEQGIHRG